MAVGIGGYNSLDINTGNAGTTVQNSSELIKKVRNADAEAVEKSKSGKDGADSAKASAAASESKSDVDNYISSNPKGQVYKMSDEERASLVSALKDEQEQITQKFLSSMVTKDILTQAGAFGNATGDGIWKYFASGNFTVDEETKKNAQEAISEDGYFGIAKTSQRIFDFVSAAAGDDEELMREYQKAVEDGFAQATKAWGKDLPKISQDTHAAVNKLFDDYYNKKSAASTITEG